MLKNQKCLSLLLTGMLWVTTLVAPSASATVYSWANRHVTFSDISLDGQGPYSVVKPGQLTSLTFNWAVNTDRGNIYCPGCVIQFYLGIQDTASACFTSRTYTPGSTGSGSKTIQFEAPTAEGIYYLHGQQSLQYNCKESISFSTSPEGAIGILRVDAKSYNEGDWQDAFAITFAHGNIDYRNQSVDLSIGNNNEPAFIKRNLFEDIDQQPIRASWSIRFPGNTQKYFTLQNRETGEFLGRKDNSNQLIMLKSPIDPANSNNYSDRALWSLQTMSAQGDMALYSKSQGVGPVQFVHTDDERNRQVFSVQLAQNVTDYDSSIFLRLTDRFQNLFLNTTDIDQNDGLVRLPSGLPMDALFLPTTDLNHPLPVKRNFKFSIVGHNSNSYQYTSHLSFDPLAINLTAEQAAIVGNIEAQTRGIKALAKADDSVKNNAVRSVLLQLSRAFTAMSANKVWPYEGVVFIPLTGSEPAILKDIASGELDFASRIDKSNFALTNSKPLRIKLLSKSSSSGNYYFAFLVKVTDSDGNVSYRLGDPDIPKQDEPLIIGD